MIWDLYDLYKDAPHHVCVTFCLRHILSKYLYLLQYTTNFVIYAGRSEQYRRAYIQYLKTTLPWLFKIGSGSSRSGTRRQRPNIFIINSVQSAPQLTSPSKGTRGSIKVDVKVWFTTIISSTIIMRKSLLFVEKCSEFKPGKIASKYSKYFYKSSSSLNINYLH